MLCPRDSAADALMIRVLITSTGLHTVVATNPARKDAVKWVPTLSLMPTFSMQRRLKMSYEVNWEAVMRIARVELGQTPRKREVTPSVLIIWVRPWKAWR